MEDAGPEGAKIVVEIGPQDDMGHGALGLSGGVPLPGEGHHDTLHLRLHDRTGIERLSGDVGQEYKGLPGLAEFREEIHRWLAGGAPRHDGGDHLDVEEEEAKDESQPPSLVPQAVRKQHVHAREPGPSLVPAVDILLEDP